jgi:hypothetical protein
MAADIYLRHILNRERVGTTLLTSPLAPVKSVLLPSIQAWAGIYLVDVMPSGSFAKGTAVSSGTDIDFLISLSSTTPATLKNIYETLYNRLQSDGFFPRPQNVSIGITVGKYHVDVVPAKRQDQFSNDHSLYRRKSDSWIQTNIRTHINVVNSSRRLEEIMILKMWRNQKNLDFPSFFLELLAIKACHGRAIGALSDNVWETFKYIRDNIEKIVIIDPSNTNNRISDDLSAREKILLKNAAVQALAAKNWNQIVV